jgi:hypothetical protein
VIVETAQKLLWAGTAWIATAAAIAAAQDIPFEGGYFAEQTARVSPWPSGPVDAGAPVTGSVEQQGLAAEATSVFAGRVQIESGYSFLYDRDELARQTQHYFPDLLVRYGLTDRLELRLGWAGWMWSDIDGRGFDASDCDALDPSFGAMYDLGEQNGIVPQTAVLVSAPIPFDGDPLAVGAWQPLSELLYLWRLSDRTAIVGDSGFGLFSFHGDDYIQLQNSLGVEYVLADRVSTYLQWETLLDCGSADDGIQHLLEGGGSYLINEWLDVGLRAGLGLNERAPDLLTGIRFTVRL